MITTGSVYDKSLSHDCYRILVMRRWPRGIRKTEIDLWLRDVAPSSDLLNAYRGHTIGWREFVNVYRKEANRQPDLLNSIKEIEHAHGHVLLLCWERIPPYEHCHRIVLKQILAGMGFSSCDPVGNRSPSRPHLRPPEIKEERHQDVRGDGLLWGARSRRRSPTPRKIPPTPRNAGDQ